MRGALAACLQQAVVLAGGRVVREFHGDLRGSGSVQPLAADVAAEAGVPVPRGITQRIPELTVPASASAHQVVAHLRHAQVDYVDSGLGPPGGGWETRLTALANDVFLDQLRLQAAACDSALVWRGVASAVLAPRLATARRVSIPLQQIRHQFDQEPPVPFHGQDFAEPRLPERLRTGYWVAYRYVSAMGRGGVRVALAVVRSGAPAARMYMLTRYFHDGMQHAGWVHFFRRPGPRDAWPLFWSWFMEGLHVGLAAVWSAWRCPLCCWHARQLAQALARDLRKIAIVSPAWQVPLGRLTRALRDLQPHVVNGELPPGGGGLPGFRGLIENWQ